MLVQLPVTWEQTIELMQDAVHSLAVDLGQHVAARLLEEEVESAEGGAGPKHARQPKREVSRHGHHAGFVVLAGQKLPIQKPRVRPTQRVGGEEVELETYALTQSPEAMPRSALLEELTERGLTTDQPIRRGGFVLDGAKALTKAVLAVWGRYAVIQSAAADQIHKQRNVLAHVPEQHQPQVLQQLRAAYHADDYGEALNLLQKTERWLDKLSPNAAASLRQGLEETLTVVRLKLPERLRRTLATTNPIESAFHTTRLLTRRDHRLATAPDAGATAT